MRWKFISTQENSTEITSFINVYSALNYNLVRGLNLPPLLPTKNSKVKKMEKWQIMDNNAALQKGIPHVVTLL